MNKIQITRENGNIPKTLAGQDHVSGLLLYVPSASVPTAFATSHIQAVSTIDAAESLGLTSDSENWFAQLAHYHISEALRKNPGISLYVGIYASPETHTFAEVRAMQQYANGAIRQIGIWDGSLALTSANVALLQSVADGLDLENAPLIVGITSKVTAVGSLPTNLAGAAPRVSVIIAQDGSGTGNSLYTATANTTPKNTVGCIGLWLGDVSAASVHESIGWVKKFPSGITLPAFGDGSLVRQTDKATLESLDTARYTFLAPVVGLTGSYWNDSSNLDAATSDYNTVELVRTMDKAVRGIRTYLTPELGGNVYIDAESGKLQPYTVSHLQLTAQKAIEDMEKAGELSGYAVEIDPEQDVLSTSRVEIVIKNVPVGVVRTFRVKIGYVKSV